MTAPSSVSNDDDEVLTASPSAHSPQDTGIGNIKVAVRLRPMGVNPDVGAWMTETDGTMVSLIQKGHPRRVEGRTVFHFDQVFDEEVQTPRVYQNIARPMVPAVLNGKHATIFAYGQTGSGKTFTMQGEGKIESGQVGIIQLVISDFFRYMRQYEASKRAFEVKVSYFEIHNEKIRDLLSDDMDIRFSDSNSTTRSDPVNIRTNANGEIVVNVEQVKIDNADEALTILAQGNAQRTVAATDMNTYSSRSHSVFRLTVESRGVDEQQPFRVSDFNLVDLAGSESLKATKTSGIRQREGATINKSLLALTNVIHALSQPTKKRPQHINYRDSKLTRILQPHLSGNAEMAILCCASRSKHFIEETRSTLKFASRAKLVQIKPKINEVMDDSAMIKLLESQLLAVRKELELAEKKLRDELKREPVVIDSTIDTKEAMLQLDASTPGVAKKAFQRFPKELLNSSLDSTANLSSEFERSPEKRNQQSSKKNSVGESQNKLESYDSPMQIEDQSEDGSGTNHLDTSSNACCHGSNPETILAIQAPIFRSQDPEDSSPNGRLENNLSWDAMAVSAKSLAQTTVKDKKNPIPGEITIIESMVINGNKISLIDRLKDSEARIQFLEEKLELSDNIIEAGCRDLQRARHCIRDLVQRNVEMKDELIKRGREVTKEYYEKGEIMVEQYWILRVSLYGGVFFFISGAEEYFMGTAFFVWLALEMNVTA